MPPTPWPFGCPARGGYAWARGAGPAVGAGQPRAKGLREQAARWLQRGGEACRRCLIGGALGAPTSEGRETHGPPATGAGRDPGVCRSPPTSHPNLFALPPPLPAVTAGRNPCADRNGGCMHMCRARQGVAHCECHPGYQLAADRKACEGRMPFLRPSYSGQPLPSAACGGTGSCWTSLAASCCPSPCRAGLGPLSAAGLGVRGQERPEGAASKPSRV